MKSIAAIAFAAALALSLSGVMPAAAASKSTARSSAVEAIHSGPGSFYPVVGTLAKGEIVHLERCTFHSRWCYVLRSNGEPEGWVLGSYLIGSPAKVEVTPWDFLYRPFPFPLHP